MATMVIKIQQYLEELGFREAGSKAIIDGHEIELGLGYMQIGDESKYTIHYHKPYGILERCHDGKLNVTLIDNEAVLRADLERLLKTSNMGRARAVICEGTLYTYSNHTTTET